MSEPPEELTNRPFAVQLSNVYLSILALFCFKLFVKISLNLLTYFYIVRGNRKEAARISAEFYDYGQQQRSWADRSPLHDAAAQGRLLALKTLIVQVKYEQGHKQHFLGPRVFGVHHSTISRLVERYQATGSSNDRSRTGHPRVTMAPHISVTGFGPPPGPQCKRPDIDHVTPLHEACLGDHVACARALIDAGANVNASTIDGVTPLFNALLSGQCDVCRAALGEGARPQTLVFQLHRYNEATSKGHYGCVEALVTWGADVDMDIPHLGTALYTACVCQELECARKLLREGANVQKGRCLDSPLHAAAEKDCTAVVKLLLDFGADINARNTEYQRPVDVAPPSSLTEGFLLLYEATPRLLSQMCRQCIRGCVGRDRLHLLAHLPLPSRLQRYLQYQ
ncbi:hypothetical protein WMY93_009118 [Mugilogobius chulae]|uniref:SOCS box domain-containing protein n=1 Tax=Mugilogobius chulae TaxID=88201 RepID=A0AAW0PAU3_9GOBI